MKKNLVGSILFLILSLTAIAQPIRIAAASNTQFVIKALKADFEKKTGIETEIIFGSSGKLTAQIQNGAPYDIFLSANMEFPKLLYKKHMAINKPKIYALGSLVICSQQNIDIKNWKNLITSSSTKKIALANPQLAPYGKAAEQTLKLEKLYNEISKKLVFGENIAQVNTYISTGVVDFGFTTESFINENKAIKHLKWLRINPNNYRKIEQGMVLLKHASITNYSNALKFYNYLSSAAAKQIFRKNGYQTP